METIILKTQHFLIIFPIFYNDLYPGGFYVSLFLFGFCCCSSVAKLYLTLCNPMGCHMPGSPVLHCLLERAQIHVHWVDDATQPSHALLPSSFAFNLSKHQGIFRWVSSSHQVARVLELQLQHQSFQWIFRIEFLWDGLVGFEIAQLEFHHLH